MKFVYPISAVLSLSLLAGCSGSGDDPRITLCRDLAAKLSKTDVAQWQHAGNRFKGSQYAVVSVDGGKGGAACYYAYDAVEEGAMEHANPLLAYATLPYQVSYNGRDISGPALNALVSGQQIEYAENAVEQARSAAEQAGEAAQRAAERASEAIQQAVQQ